MGTWGVEHSKPSISSTSPIPPEWWDRKFLCSGWTFRVYEYVMQKHNDFFRSGGYERKTSWESQRKSHIYDSTQCRHSRALYKSRLPFLPKSTFLCHERQPLYFNNLNICKGSAATGCMFYLMIYDFRNWRLCLTIDFRCVFWGLKFEKKTVCSD